MRSEYVIDGSRTVHNQGFTVFAVREILYVSGLASGSRTLFSLDKDELRYVLVGTQGNTPTA
jgi:hypothetical protein